MTDIPDAAALVGLPDGTPITWRLIPSDPSSTVAAIVYSHHGAVWLRYGDSSHDTSIVRFPARAVTPAGDTHTESRAVALHAATALGCTLRAKGITFDISELLDTADDFTNWMEGRR